MTEKDACSKKLNVSHDGRHDRLKSDLRSRVTNPQFKSALEAVHADADAHAQRVVEGRPLCSQEDYA